MYPFLYSLSKHRKIRRILLKMRWNMRRLLFSLFTVFCVIFMLFFVVRNEIIENFVDYDNSVAGHIFKCLSNKFVHGESFSAAFVWLYLQEEVNKCRNFTERQLYMEAFTGDERKFFIPGIDTNFTYTMMTLGVGQNIQAEITIMKKYPTCSKYVAVDPSSEINKKLVGDVGGIFLQRAVSIDEGIKPANIMDVKKSYDFFNVTHTSLRNIIKEVHMTSVIDLMLIDVEGAEFEILFDLIEHSNSYPIICQMNVELHSPWNNGIRQHDIIQTLHNLMKKKKFLLFHVEAIQIHKQVFNRCFFVNVKDDYCINKYYPVFKKVY